MNILDVPSPSVQSRILNTGYDIFLLLGQSNMQGDSGGSIASQLDISDPRVWTYGATGSYASQIVQASDPLAHRGGSSVVGPAMSFATWYANSITTSRRVLLVPAAYNGTAFGSGTLRWDPTTNWPNDGNNLYNLAISQTLSAVAAAGSNSRIVAAIWVQGESDVLSGMSASTYRTYLEQLIDGLRFRLSLPNLPFVIGSMVPEFVASNGSAAVAIDNVHQTTPSRKRFTSYVMGPNAMQRGDNLHYSPAGQREQGRRMVSGLSNAMSNVTPSNVVADNPPASPAAVLVNSQQPSLSGTINTGQTLTTTNGTWSPTPDSYTYQWRRAGSSISGATSYNYVLQLADEGQSIYCSVTAIKSGYASVTVSSNTVIPSANSTNIADNFNRADNASSLGTTSTGNVSWTAVNGTWGVISNQAYQPSNTSNALAVVDVGSTGQYSECMFISTDAGSCIVVRCSDANNWYGLLISSNMTLYKRVNGNTTAIGNAGSATASDVIRLSVTGSTITVSKNGNSTNTFTDSSLTTGKPGLRTDTSSARFDNFAAGPA